MNTMNTTNTSPQGRPTTLSPEDGVKALTGLWGTQFTLDDAALLGSGGADVAADLFGDLGTPTVTAPEPAAEPVAALAKSTADTESGNSTSDSPIPKPRSQGQKAASVSPTIRKKPLPRPHGVPSTAPRAATADLDLDSSDDELPTGVAGDCAWEDPDGAFASDDDDSGGDLSAPTHPIKSRKAPAGKRIAPRSRSLARTLTPREKEMQRQEREDARIQRDALRKEREHEEEYNRVSKECEVRQSCRGKALDMLDGLIPLGLGATGKSTHFRRQNVATRDGHVEKPVAVPDTLDAQVRSYLNQPKLTPALFRTPQAILHNRVVALQRATSAPGAIGVLEMRRTLKDPKWLPYERQRDMKNRVTTKGAESRKAHGQMLAIQAAEFDRVASEKREARLKAARDAFSATECAVPTSTGTLPAHKGMTMTQSPLSAAC